MERDSRKILRRLEAEGWLRISARGSHHKFRRKDGETIVVPHPQKGPAGGYCASYRQTGRLDLTIEGTTKMRTYFALVEHEKDSAFGVRFPDLPGVFSAADTRADVIPNAIEALRLWAEDEALPVPADHDSIVARDDIREALASGAYLVEVPLIEQESETVRANVSFDRGTLRAIDAEAARRKQTRAAFLADAARHEIERPLSRFDGKQDRKSRTG